MFLWKYLDGCHSIDDLNRLTLENFGLIATDRIEKFISLLDNRSWITIENRQRPQKILFSKPTSLADYFAAISRMRITLHGFDPFVQWLYSQFAYLFFTPLAQILLGCVTIVGLGIFFFKKYHLATPVCFAPDTWLQTLIFTLAYTLISLLIHELAHALVCKHWGRQVNAAGFMLYFGMPAFFVDTTDVWMAPRSARILVAFAGPYSNLILGAIASLVSWVWGGSLIQTHLLRFAALSVFVGAFNLIPWLKLDGYYIFSEVLGEYNLQKNALLFFTSGKLFKGILQGQGFTKKEWGYVLYGLTTVSVSIFLLYWFWLILFKNLIGWMLTFFAR